MLHSSEVDRGVCVGCVVRSEAVNTLTDPHQYAVSCLTPRQNSINTHNLGYSSLYSYETSFSVNL